MQELLKLNVTRVSNLPLLKPHGLVLSYNSEEVDLPSYNKSAQLPFEASDVFLVPILNHRKLADGYNKVYEVTFQMKNTILQYKPGDTIGVIPKNDKKEVDFIIKHLGIDKYSDLYYNITLDTKLTKKVPPHVPIKATVRYVLTNCLDLRGVLKKMFLLALSNYTTNEQEKLALQYLCTKDGSNEYNKLLSENTCLLDIFEHFKSCKPPIELLLLHLGRLLPRPYSIANSNSSGKDQIKICFSTTKGKRKGVATGYLEEIIKRKDIETALESLVLNDRNKNVGSFENVPVYLRKNMNNFVLPSDVSKPIILIALGTGVAPFMGFLEEISIMKEKDASICLFYGCKSPDDFVYRKEIENYLKDGVLTRLYTAFSRVGDKEYVQDLIKRNGKEFTRLIEDGAFIFVCGDINKVSEPIKESIIECFTEHTSMDENGARKYFEDLVKDKRYLVDVWN